MSIAGNMIQVFAHECLDTGGNPNNIAIAESEHVKVQGNVVTVALTNLNSRGAFSMFVGLWMSYDGKSWKDIGTFTNSGFGYQENTVSGIDGAHVKLTMLMSGSDSAALFNATISLAER